MPQLIGIDTGGTYTDAVVFSPARGVLAKAKALTTQEDLSLGIGAAVDAALAGAGGADHIGLVSLSTTLATNAIVEGRGDRVGLVLIGFAEADLARGGFGHLLGQVETTCVPGGHDAHGGEAAALDMSGLPTWIDGEAAAARAFAVAAQFSVANPAHELAVRDLIAARTGAPVTCSHELSARLNAPKRALTTLLNARLIGIIHHLLDATEGLLRARRIGAPVMVVKGDGSLISAAQARLRPIETILSGPAASLVGARYLTGLDDALVADIGGTTTDVALLRGGRPRLDPNGARVGGWSTLVEAVAMHTVGLGGDSDVRQPPGEATLRLALGPRRVVPVSLAAARFAAEIHAALDRQLALPRAAEESGRFAIAARRAGAPARPDDAAEAELLSLIGERPVALDALLAGRRQRAALRRLQQCGAVLIAGFTPSDAAHVLGRHQAWDRDAAVKAATLFARRQTSRGEKLAPDAEAISRAVVEALELESAATLLDAAFAEAADALPDLGPEPSAHPLVRAALRQQAGLVRLGVTLSVPVVALGAAARTYYGAIAARLNTEAVIPEHADVANAIGAVVGHVRVAAEALISRPSDGLFRAHLVGGPTDFSRIDDAADHAEAVLRADVAARARANGALHVDISVERAENAVMLGDTPMVLEMRITVTAIGRPAIADSDAWRDAGARDAQEKP